MMHNLGIIKDIAEVSLKSHGLVVLWQHPQHVAYIRLTQALR